MKGEGVFLITFSPAKIDDAHCPDQMYSQAKLKKRIGGVKSSCVEDFIKSGEFHKERGEYVFGKIQENHEAFRVQLFSILLFS